MGDDRANYGINISGQGQLDSEVTAVGPEAKAVQYRQVESVDALVAELRAAIEEHRDALADPDEAFAQVETVANELRSEQPDRSRILTTLASLREGVGSATGLVQAVDALAHAVGVLI